MTLEERVQQLTELSARRPIVRLNGAKFKNLVGSRSHPRNYSVVVMLTALSSQRQCQVCRQAHDEYAIVANSWRYMPDFSNKLFFAMVDYDEGADVFNLLGLNSAPVFLFFSDKKTSIKAAEQMDIQRVGFSADMISRWIQEKSDISIRVLRPPNYSGTFALIILFALVASLLYMKRNNLDFLYNRSSWGLLAVFTVLAMTSGQMWNHIRGPPLMHRTQKGVSYIHHSSSGQFVIETYIIILLNGTISLGIFLMNEGMRGKADPKRRRVMAVAGLCLTAVFFSLLLSIFKGKAHGYPYSFLFK